MRRALLLALLASCSREPTEAERLLGALERGEPEGREITKLGPGDAAAVPLLVERLGRGGGRAVLVPVLEALGNIGDRSATGAAVEAIGNDDPHVSLAAAACHWRLTGAYAPGLEHIVREAVSPGPAHPLAVRRLEQAGPLPPEAVADLTVAARECSPVDPPRRAAILHALAAAGAQVRDALPAVRDAVEDPDARVEALWALHRVGGETDAAVRGLLDAVAAAPALGRRSVVAVLERAAAEAPGAALPALREALDAPDEARRAAAVHVLGALGGAAREARADLERLAAEDPSPDVRAGAARAAEAVTPPGS